MRKESTVFLLKVSEFTLILFRFYSVMACQDE